jgi:NAD(P)-dependent dehydrogenase (short-subunit alcohol dehydrogenase family)
VRELAGKTAFLTGGASGIGFALGRAFAEAGMKVTLADIETDALAAAVTSLHDFGPDVRGVTCDVADSASVEHAARASYEAFGNVHVVCNNAGVVGGSGIDNILLDNWRRCSTSTSWESFTASDARSGDEGAPLPSSCTSLPSFCRPLTLYCPPIRAAELLHARITRC